VMHSTLSREEFLSFRSALDSAKQRVIDSIEQADEMRLEAVLEDLDCDEDIADALLVTRTDGVVWTVLTLWRLIRAMLFYTYILYPMSGSQSRRVGRWHCVRRERSLCWSGSSASGRTASPSR
jgi:hypothetical protein